MHRKVFTILLSAVFILTQFNMAAAATVAGTASITSIPEFSIGKGADIDWAVTGMAAGTKNILIWAREVPAAAYALTECQLVATINGTSDASGTFSYDFTTTTLALANADQVEFTITVDDQDCGGAPTLPVMDSVMGTTYIDNSAPNYFHGNPPSTTGINPLLDTAACNTFEYWALAFDNSLLSPTMPYSGFNQWNPSVTGTFATPAPAGPASSLLSWVFTFPSTASGMWTATIQPEDMAGNTNPVTGFRSFVVPTVAEKTECATFSDVSGHEDEVYIRYLATLGLISGFADGTFGPDNTLTRAEAATLFEISNGYDSTTLPTSAPAGCDFTDVTVSDWFAGWVWQACDDGFMNGVGGGLFDPNNLLTRGQVVTIFNNIYPAYIANPAAFGGYIITPNPLITVYSLPAFGTGYGYRQAAWTDVSVGAYYTVPVQKAYGWGIADGTSETTFSPDQAATRGEFAKMLYRALSKIH
ncbi:MAG TPA: S-layer homology domain-containing protein [Anaerolineales bacterium]|nr:S-layer homology domain-containing protein [Anaerolineales bacterium]